MSFDLVIRGGTVVLPETDGVAADIAISKGRIAAILAPETAVDAREALDVAGKTILPGVIDVHLHLGHGKDIARPRVLEDAANETAAAATGGVTTFIPYLMATDPFETLFDEVKAVTEAVSFMKRNRPESERIISKYMKLTDPNLVSIEYNFNVALFPDLPYPTLDGVRLILENLAAENPEHGRRDPKEFVDSSIVDRLKQEKFLETIGK